MTMFNQIVSKLKFSQPQWYILAVFFAVINGVSNNAGFHKFGFLISDLFIQIFQCVSLPIISLSIIVTLLNYSKSKVMKQVWQLSMRYTLLSTLIAASISCLLYLLIQPALVTHSPKSSLNLGPQQSYLTHLSNLVPSNIFAPFIDHQVIAVLLISLIIGLSIKQIPDENSRKVVIQFFRGIHAMFMVITRWIVAVIPLGLFGFMSTTLVQLRDGMSLKGIGQYLLIILLANLIQGFIVLPLWLRARGIKPFAAMKAMLPALSLAFFSKSSVGSLPVTMDTIEKNLDVKPEISRFVLPLCTSINMNGCAAFIFTTVIYLMQNHGIEISLPLMFLWIVISTIAAIGNAGVPMGCFFISSSLLGSMNVPILLMGIILPFYSLIDMLESSLNVWSDICVTKVVNEDALSFSEKEVQADSVQITGSAAES